ncbi:MAG: S1C family serine protease [Planctomycetota bacterium]
MMRLKGIWLTLFVLGLLGGVAWAGDVDEEIEKILKKFDERYEKLRQEMKRELERILKGKEAPPPKRGGSPYLGIDVEPVKEGLRVLLNLGKGEGLVVRRVVENGPCHRVGIRKWDILLSLAGKEVGSKGALREVVSDLRPGQRVKMVILRDGERISATLTVGSRGGTGPPPRRGDGEQPRSLRGQIRRQLKALMEGGLEGRMRARRFFENLFNKAGGNREKIFREIEEVAEEMLGRLSPADRKEMRKVFQRMLRGFRSVVKPGKGSQKKEDIEKFLEDMLGGKKPGTTPKKTPPAKDDIDKLLDDLLGKGKPKKTEPGDGKKGEDDGELPITIPPKWDKAMKKILGEEGWERIKKMMKAPEYREMIKQFFPEGFEFTPDNVKKLLQQYGIELDSLPDRLREMGVDEQSIKDIMKLLEAKDTPVAKKVPGWIGIRARDVGEEEGVRVTRVESGGPAEAGGLKAGDVIIRIGRKKIGDKQALKDILTKKFAGDKLKITVLREGERVKLTVTLQEKK